MSRVIVYGPDGSVQSAYDTAGTSETASAPSNGANGVIKATSISNSGDTTLSGALGVTGAISTGGGVTLTGGTLTFADGSTLASATAATGGGGSGGPSNGATGAVNATSISNSGDTNLTGALIVAGTSALNGATNTKALTVQGKAIFQDTSSFTGQMTGQVLQVSTLNVTNNATLQKVTFADGTTQSTATLKGDKGDTGAASTVPGPKGDQGIQGIQGVKGDTGAASTVPGPKGDKGDTGPAASGDITATSINDSGALTVAGVTTLNGNTVAKALSATSIANSGNESVGGTLGVTGATTLAALTATTSTLGNTTVNNLTLAANGKVTFADGTTQATASTGGGSGTAGPAFRYTTGGAPTSTNPSVQNDGDTAFDPTNVAIYGPRANGSFPTQPYNLVGPTGAPGPSMLTSQSAGCGPAFVATGTVSTTATPGVTPGTSIAQTWNQPYASAFLGLTYCNNNTANDVVATLVNQTTQATVWSGTLTKNLCSNFGQFPVTQYPLAANTPYVFNLTSAASNTANLYVQPIYLFPAASNIYNVSSLATVAWTGTFSSTATAPNVAGTNGALAFKFPKALNLFSVTVTNTSTGSVTVRLVNASSTTIWTQTVPSGASSVVYGPFAQGLYPLAANMQYYYLMTGSGTGTIVIDTQLLSTIA